MKLICLDTNTIIWGVQHTASNGQEDMIPRARTFIEKCEKQKTGLAIPTVVVAELLAKVPTADRDGFLELISSRFVILPFDVPAAVAYGRTYPDSVSAQQAKSRGENGDGRSKSCIKADHMIAASAVASQCDGFCTDDGPLGNFIEGIGDKPLKVYRLNEMATQPSFAYDEEAEPSED